MPCSGCARRRAKIALAYKAMKQGIVSAKKTYAAQAVNLQNDGTVNIIDIREKKA